MVDLTPDLSDIAIAIANTLKGRSDPQWKLREEYKEWLSQKAPKMMLRPYIHQINSLVGIYEKIKGTPGDSLEEARRQIITTVTHSLDMMGRYRDGVRAMNEKIDLYTQSDLKELDKIVDDAWSAARPCLK